MFPHSPLPVQAKIQAGLCAYFTYSVLQVRAVTGYRLLRLGGSWLDEDLAWNGDWSSTSLIWEQNPDVARTLGFKPGQAQESQVPPPPPCAKPPRQSLPSTPSGPPTVLLSPSPAP